MVRAAAAARGRLLFSVYKNPAMMGGTACPSERIDWLIPMISPCSAAVACCETTVVMFGAVIPWEMAIKGLSM